jgi:hypothetical protein
MSNVDQAHALVETCLAAGHLYVASLKDFDICPLCELVDGLRREVECYKADADRWLTAFRELSEAEAAE